MTREKPFHPAETSAAQTGAVIVAAGTGSRVGGDRPKQFLLLAGVPVLVRAVRALANHPAIGPVVVVTAPDQMTEARALLGDDVTIVAGGATRRQSVRNGLSALKGANLQHVLIHDAARPLLPAAVIDRLLDALRSHAGAIPVLPVVDTLSRGAEGMLQEGVDRVDLYRVQTPQAFAYDAIMTIHDEWKGDEPTDDASMARDAACDVALVEGDTILAKITYWDDLARAEHMLGGALMIPRTGFGYDVHRLEPGRPLWLCGVQIAHDLGLAGHSDADVAIHALVDALLGALAEGDIGKHFPPSDERWRGAASNQFLDRARTLVEARGGRIAHVDVTIICEAPKIGPYRDQMRAALAEILRIDTSRVSVKATTTEKLGFTGRGEGIAAHAVATVLLPE